MRKKYCTLRNKAVYAKLCIEWGGLKQTEMPIKKIGPLFERRDDGTGVLYMSAEYETLDGNAPICLKRLFSRVHTQTIVGNASVSLQNRHQELWRNISTPNMK